MAAVAHEVRGFGAPTEIVHGPGSVRRIGDETRRLGGGRVLLVSDHGLARAGVAGGISDEIGRSGVPLECHLDVPADPTFDDVDRVVAAVREHRADTVVSVGSGSVLAAGRAAAVAATHPGPSIELRGANRATHPPLLSICVPTTAGSGGEVSRQATITDPSGHKSGIQGWAVAARLAILDAELLASTMANLACGNAGLGLVHGLNKGITFLFHTGGYPTVSYGDLHAVLLPFVNEFNAPAAPARYARLARLMGVAPELGERAAVSAGTDRLKEWLAALGAPRRLPWTACPPEHLDVIVGDVLGRAMAADNPRESSAEELRAIVERCIDGW